MSHNNDCTDCDVRLASIPGGVHSLSSDDLSSSTKSGSCPIYPCKFTFPRFIGKDKGPDYDREKLYQESFHNKEKLISQWPNSKPLGHTKQGIKNDDAFFFIYIFFKFILKHFIVSIIRIYVP